MDDPPPATNAHSVGIFIGINQGVVREEIIAKERPNSPHP